MKRLEAIAKAQEITDLVFAEIRELIQPGMTEDFIAKEIRKRIKKHGGDTKLAFDSIVCSGKRTALFHGPTSKKRIQKNDIVYIDMGAKYHGWCADLTRTFFLGKPNKQLTEIYKHVLTAQKKQIAMIKPGVKTADIDLAGRNYLKKHKLDTYFIHSTGHGVGRKVHQKPRVSYKSGAKLKIGDVITVEPGVYIKGLGGVRIEDLLIVTKTGYTNLTQSPK